MSRWFVQVQSLLAGGWWDAEWESEKELVGWLSRPIAWVGFTILTLVCSSLKVRRPGSSWNVLQAPRGVESEKAACVLSWW